ncbi:hypothetical protein NH340_JMT07182 [Sarcoptes scabiei]|nr:hypothetical protein NH340_JMT07182 [Sarcoptes scabiei]
MVVIAMRQNGTGSTLVAFMLASISVAKATVQRNQSCNCVHGICLSEDENSIRSSSNNNHPTKASCFCYNGYTGKDCSINYDECLSERNPCKNNAKCINDVPDAKCLCPKGFCGKYCEMDIDECQSNPCMNGGVCVDQIGDYECVCPLGYSGSNCEIDVDACSFDLFGNLSAISDRCYNGGTCKDGPGDRYFCVCPPGFSGAKCETFLNPCRSSPCLNDGLCQPDGHRFKCICPYGWSGSICQQPMRQCHNSSRCLNNGLCMTTNSIGEEENKFRCFCPPDFHGDYCQFKFDECRPNDCKNGATCLDGIDGYSCRCPKGFAGFYCEIDCRQNYLTDLCLLWNLKNEDNDSDINLFPDSAIDLTSLSSTQTPSINLSSSLTTTSLPSTTSAAELSVQDVPETNRSQSSIVTFETINEPSSYPKSISNDSMEFELKNKTNFSTTRIYSPRFNGKDSKITYKLRRLKRTESSLRTGLISHNENGTILHAYTNRFNLLIYLEKSLVQMELNDQNQQNLLHLGNDVPIKIGKPYLIEMNLQSRQQSLDVEFNLFNAYDGQLIESKALTNQNLTIPCFEWYRFGQPPSVTDNELFLKPFDGCLFRIQLNNELKLVHDSYQIENIDECYDNVCDMKPCLNNGRCLFDRLKTDWTCSCPIGFRGWLCEEAHCTQDYCSNGGLCLLGDNKIEDDFHRNQHRHREPLCICPQGFLGFRCEFKMNLTFPSYNLGSIQNGPNKSFIKYKLSPYNLQEFFEIRFRFLPNPLDQNNSLLMFMSQFSSSSPSSSSSMMMDHGNNLLSLIYQNKFLILSLNLGQGESSVKAPIETNITEQMVLFGRFKQIFWLLVIPNLFDSKLKPQIGRTPLHKTTLDVDPFLYVGGHEDWSSHTALSGLQGFKGCIYDIEIRVSRQSQFKKIEENLIDNLANIGQCDFECL